MDNLGKNQTRKGKHRSLGFKGASALFTEGIFPCSDPGLANFTFVGFSADQLLLNVIVRQKFYAADTRDYTTD